MIFLFKDLKASVGSTAKTRGQPAPPRRAHALVPPRAESVAPTPTCCCSMLLQVTPVTQVEKLWLAVEREDVSRPKTFRHPRRFDTQHPRHFDTQDLDTGDVQAPKTVGTSRPCPEGVDAGGEVGPGASRRRGVLPAPRVARLRALVLLRGLGARHRMSFESRHKSLNPGG